MEEIEKYIEEEKTYDFINKSQYVNTEQQFEISSVGKFNNRLCLLINEPNVEEEVYYTPSMSVKNKLIKLYGNDPHSWVGEFIDLKFTEFKPRPEQKHMSSGIKIDLVNAVEEEKINS